MGKVGGFAARAPLSRRTMLKTACAIGAAGAVGGMFHTEGWLAPAKACAEPEEHVSYTYHCANCGTPACALKCTVRDGRIAMIEPNQGWAEKDLATICLKGISEINRIYSSDRLQTPLKRVGARGSGEFVEITWDEAIATVCDAMTDSIEKNGPTSVALYSSSAANTDSAISYISALLGIPARRAHPGGGGIDCGIGNGAQMTIGVGPIPGCASDVRDWDQADMVVLSGMNPAESQLQYYRYIANAQESGTKIVVIDPRFSVTVGKADWWLPIKPGTDPAFFTAVCHEIIENKMYDEEFLVANTSACWLVDVSTGNLVADVVAGEDKDGKPIEKSVYYVWDEAAGASVKYTETSVSPALFGEYVVDGKTCKTVMQLMKEEFEDKTPEWAAQITELDAGDIVKFAKEYAQAESAYLAYGMGGADKYGNSDITGHAMTLLPSLTGNWGRAGTGFGQGIVPLTHPATLGAWKLPEEFKVTPLAQSAATWTTEENPVRVFVGIGNPLQQLFADMNKMAKWLDTLDFVAILNPYHCTSVDYADVVLPTTSCFECESDVRGVQTRKDHVVLAEKVIDPLFESKTDFEVERLMCEYLGFGDLVPSSSTELVETMLKGASEQFGGVTIESLKQSDCIMRLDVPTANPVLYKDQVYKTPSTKLELYHQKMAKWNQAIPVHEDNLEITNEELLAKYPLQLGQGRSRARIHSQFAGQNWIKSINGPAHIRVNKIDADARGISNGDSIRVYNDRGSVTLVALVDNDARPGMLMLQEGWWTSQCIEGNLQTLTNGALLDRQRDCAYGPVIPFEDTLVEIEKA